MDLGGVTKEFFHLVSEQMLDPRANLFIPQGPNNTFHPSPSSAINGTPPSSSRKPCVFVRSGTHPQTPLRLELHLEYFRFFGRFLGKALIEERLVKAPLTRAIWKLLLGAHTHIQSLRTTSKQFELIKFFSPNHRQTAHL